MSVPKQTITTSNGISSRPSENDVSHDGCDNGDARYGEERQKLSTEDFVDASDAPDDLNVKLEYIDALGLKIN